MDSQPSVNVGSSNEPYVVEIIETGRSKDVFGENGSFDLVRMSNGKEKARCRKCGALLQPNSNSTLRNHISKYCKTVKDVGQSSGQPTVDVHGGIFQYDFNRVQDRMAKFVIQEGLPFNHFDNPKLTKLIRETLQPRYKHVSRHTLKRHCMKLWKKVKQELIMFFTTLQTGVNLTTDVWSAPHGLPESYLCVTAHWVDPGTWQMMKRTIAFELFEYPHTGENIFSLLDKVIQTFNLEHKIFSISFDNASSNTLAVEKLMIKYPPICNGIFFHTRCVAHILNLVVQDGFNVPIVDNFRQSFRLMLHQVFKSSRERYRKYKEYCKDTGKPVLGPNWDVPTRWNSTCTMFESGLKQKSTLQPFHNRMTRNGRFDPFPEEGWTCLQQLSDYLEVFKNATTRLSGVYYPTSPEVLTELNSIVQTIYEFEETNDVFEQMIPPMKDKFEKYFLDIPPVFMCALALNPCLNCDGVYTMIEEVSGCLRYYETRPNWINQTKTTFDNAFQALYDTYVERYGPTLQMETGSSSGKSSRRPQNRIEDKKINFFNTVKNVQLKRQRGRAHTSELTIYKNANFLTNMSSEEYAQFDLLRWWRDMEQQYPIMAAMARDVLTVQASTVASESAFSFSGRVLYIRRTRLSPESLEMCICLKNHLDAVDRVQDQTNLEDILEIEEPIHQAEIDEGSSEPLTEEEEAHDAKLRTATISSSDEE